MIGKLPVQKLLFLAFFLVVHLSASGQYASDNGLFFVDQIRGCPGLTVTITNNNPVCDCVICACNFDYNGDGMFTVQPDKYRYTYNAPGVYRMEILFSGTSDFITITIEDKPAPDFQLQRCSANGVEVTVNDSNYDSYDIDFGDGSPVVNVPASAPEATYFYATSNTFPISVRGNDANSANNCQATAQSFDALPTLAPATIDAVRPIDNNSVEITYTPGDPNTQYNILRSASGGSFQNVGQVFPTSAVQQTTIVTGLDLSNAYYCFLLEAEDPCSGTNVPSPTQGCTIQLNVANQNGNRLTWAGRDPDTAFEIYRDGSLIATAQPGERLFVDSDLICGETYCYTVQGISAIQMNSLEECVVAESTEPPPAVDDLSIRPEGSGLALTWLYMTNAEFDVYRSIDGSQPELIATVTTLEFLDTDIINAQDFEYCYEIVPKDACSNANPNNSTGCAFTPSGGIDAQDNITLSWPPYLGYLTGIDYYDVEKSYDGVTFTSAGQTSDTTFFETDMQADAQVVYYRILAYSANGMALPSQSYTIRVFKTNRLVMPDAFTPDGDGLNDIFEVSARFVMDFEMDIFNRWGELMYHSKSIDQGWNGMYLGKLAPQGTYVVQIRITDESGLESTHDGTIMLLAR